MNESVRAVVSRKFEISAERVFDAWLDPSSISSWLCTEGGSDTRIVRLEVEPRVGGNFSFVLDRRGLEFNYTGKYLELDRPQLLVFTWGTPERLSATHRVVVEISVLPRGCELTLTHVLPRDRVDLFDDEATIFWRTLVSALPNAFPKIKSLALNSS